MEVRWAVRADMPQIQEVESFNCISDRWAESDYVENLRRRNCISKILVDGEKILGVIVYDLRPKKFEVLRLVFRPVFMVESIQMLLGELVSRSRPNRRPKVIFWVHEYQMETVCPEVVKLGFQSKMDKEWWVKMTYDTRVASWS